MHNEGQPGQRNSYARGLSRGASAIEPLELRCLMSAAVAPVLHRLEIEATPSALLGGMTSRAMGPASASGIYRALGALGQSAKGAAVAIAAKSVSPFNVNLETIKQALAGAPLEFARGANAKAVVLPLP